jgi:UPF0755 protein
MIGALFRLLAMGAMLAICAGVALVVYSALGNASLLGSWLPTDWAGPVSGSPQRVTFTVEPGQSAGAVGEELERRGLIRSPLIFRWEVESRGIGNKLEAGEYELSPSMSTAEIVAVLARGASRRGASLTVLEGWRVDQLALRMEELGMASAEDVMRRAHAPRDFGLIPPDPSARSLEGYLFPDTYEVDPKSDPNQLLEKMLAQFERRFGEQLRRKAESRGLSMHQAVVLASIVERETAISSERPLVASVYLNRLAMGMKLQADPTVQYALASLDLQRARSGGFWKKELTLDDLQVDSAFNTYQNTGLPPAPICNPGLDSLTAVVEPAQTRYLYFVARGDGSHVFAETSEEHLANVRRYGP